MPSIMFPLKLLDVSVALSILNGTIQDLPYHVVIILKLDTNVYRYSALYLADSFFNFLKVTCKKENQVHQMLQIL